MLDGTSFQPGRWLESTDLGVAVVIGDWEELWVLGMNPSRELRLL